MKIGIEDASMPAHGKSQADGTTSIVRSMPEFIAVCLEAGEMGETIDDVKAVLWGTGAALDVRVLASDDIIQSLPGSERRTADAGARLFGGSLDPDETYIVLAIPCKNASIFSE